MYEHTFRSETSNLAAPIHISLSGNSFRRSHPQFNFEQFVADKFVIVKLKHITKEAHQSERNFVPQPFSWAELQTKIKARFSIQGLWKSVHRKGGALVLHIADLAMRQCKSIKNKKGKSWNLSNLVTHA